MSTAFKTISSRAVRSRSVCKRVIQYVHEKNLGTGSRLPPQEQLREQWRFGHATLSRAMRSMVRYGLLERKQKVGTIVADVNATIPNLWRVALPIYSVSDRDDLYISTLVHHLESEFSRRACNWKTYPRSSRVRGDRPDSLSDFPDLQEDVRSGYIDAVLATTWMEADAIEQLRQSGVPVCRISSGGALEYGVDIDPRRMIREVVNQWMERGHRHIAIAGHRGILSQRYTRLHDTYKEAASPLVASGGKADWITVEDRATRIAGRYLAEFILRLAPQDRPQAVLIFSDVIAVGFTQVAAEGGYHPDLVIQTNKQVPLAYALPVTQYEVDIARQAQMGVEVIMQRMCKPSTPDGTYFVEPQRVVEVPARAMNDPWYDQHVKITDSQHLHS